MKYFFILILIFPFAGHTQTMEKSLQILLNKDWVIKKAVSTSDSNEVYYDRINNIKAWGMDNVGIYRINDQHLGLMDNEGNVYLGKADSVTTNRFIVHVISPYGDKSLYEYSDILLRGNKLTYTFKKWLYENHTDKRLFHYGYYATSDESYKVTSKPTLIQIGKNWEEKKFNKISYELTADDGKPIANKEVKILINIQGNNIITYVYTDSAGKATAYYPQSYFPKQHITLLMEYGPLKSSAVIEQKYCPTILRRALTNKHDESEIERLNN